MSNRSMLRLLAKAAFAILLLVTSNAHAQSAEASLKVAFLFNFAKFVTWPEASFAAQPAVTLCIHGQDSFGAALGALKDRTVQNRPLVLRTTAKADELKGCDMAFFGTSEKAHTQGLLQALAAAPVLTVSDAESFTTSGGMIELVTENNKVGFEVNLDAVQQANLKISAQLLKVAKGVRGKSRP